jgi:hypothetical protein
MQPVEIASAVATALVATLVTALVATAAVATTMRGFTTLASDFGHVLAVLADGFTAFLGDLALLVVIHACETAIARISTATGVVARLVLVRHSCFSSAISDAICACSLQSSVSPDCARL